LTAFEWLVRVYYEDTDSGGVVYHANYLKYMERARSEWFRALGFELDQLAQIEKILFAVTQMNIKFHHPAKFNNELLISVELIEIRKASFSFKHIITVNKSDNERNEIIICSAEVKIACLHADLFKPTSIPERVLEEIKSV